VLSVIAYLVERYATSAAVLGHTNKECRDPTAADSSEGICTIYIPQLEVRQTHLVPHYPFEYQ